MNAVLRYIRKLAAVGGCRALPDPELLRRFVAHRDEAAFAGLVDRHGPLVLAACRRVLSNEQDAEDVLQAAFLVLVRKAGAIRRGAAVGSWLYGVAYRLALRVRAKAVRQRACEERAAKARRHPAGEMTWEELRPILDEELQRLPETYRAPILLCCLQGKSRDEAARELGWKEGAVKIRLERGRELLRRRLIRRGPTFSTALFPTLLAKDAVAALPVRLVVSTVGAGMKFAAGQSLTGVVPQAVATLAAEMLRAMGVAKLKTVAALLLVCAIGVGTGAVTWAKLPSRTEGPEPRAEEVARAEAPAPLVEAPPAAEEPGPRLPVPDRPLPDEEKDEKPPDTGSWNGTLCALDPARRTITVRIKESDTVYTLAPDVRVIIDRKKASLADLKLRSQVAVYDSPETKQVICVYAWGPFGYYQLQAVDVERSTLTVLWKADTTVPRTLRVAPNARIFAAEDRPIRLTDLKEGMELYLELAYADEKTVIRVRVWDR